MIERKYQNTNPINEYKPNFFRSSRFSFFSNVSSPNSITSSPNVISKIRRPTAPLENRLSPLSGILSPDSIFSSPCYTPLVQQKPSAPPETLLKRKYNKEDLRAKLEYRKISNSDTYNISYIFSLQNPKKNSRSINVKNMNFKSQKINQSNDNFVNVVISTPSSDINTSYFLSMSRNTSGILKEGNNSSIHIEKSSTASLSSPSLTVSEHDQEAPLLKPKSTPYPINDIVLSPTVGITPVPPDVLGESDVDPLSLMTLQRKHFYKQNKSASVDPINYNYSMDKSTIKSKHSLLSFPSFPSNLQNNNKSNDNVIETITKVISIKEKERVSRDQSLYANHYRSESLPGLNKSNSHYVEDQNILSPSPAIDPNTLYGLEQKLTNFELDFYKKNENQK